MAWVSQMIGMIQYHIIPVPTVSGMYGADTATVLQVEMVKRIEEAVLEFCSNWCRFPIQQALKNDRRHRSLERVHLFGTPPVHVDIVRQRRSPTAG